MQQNKLESGIQNFYKKLGPRWSALIFLLIVVFLVFKYDPLGLRSQAKDQKNIEITQEAKAAAETIEKLFNAKVVSVKLLSKEKQGLVAWTIANTSGANFVYTAGYNTDVVTFGGAALNTASKENLTLKLLSPETTQKINEATKANELEQDDGIPLMAGDFKGEVPESIKAINNLKGITFGKAPIDKTLFILFDPRCPYCKQVFDNQQKYIDKGYSFKWIPTEALGRDPLVTNQIQTVFSAKDQQAELTALMKGDPSRTQINATPDTLKVLAENQSFLIGVFKVNGGQAGVPTAFFINHKTGSPEMKQGISEEVVMKRILGE